MLPHVLFIAKSYFVLSGLSPMAFLDPSFWTTSRFGLSVLVLKAGVSKEILKWHSHSLSLIAEL